MKNREYTIQEVLDSIPQEIKGRFIPVHFKPGEVIVTEGDEVRYGYFIQEGMFDVIKSDSLGKNFILEKNHTGCFIGFMDIYSNGLMQCTTIKAATEIKGYKIPVATCMELLNTRSLFQSYLITVWAKQFYRTNQEALRYPIYSSRYKMENYLLANALKEEDTYVLSMTRETLGATLGISRRTLYRVLDELKEDNLISVGRSTVMMTEEQRQDMAEEVNEWKAAFYKKSTG